MRFFHNDYNEMCHPAVLKEISALSGAQNIGYGVDDHCKEAADMIRKLCGKEDLAVHFLVGGTQTNLTVIAASLRPHQAVIAADSQQNYYHQVKLQFSYLLIHLQYYSYLALHKKMIKQN